MHKIINNRSIAGSLIGLGITAFVSLLLALGIFDSLHYKFSSSLYTLDQPSDEIVIVAIDDKTTQVFPQGLGRISYWERDNYAKLLEQLSSDSPKVIAMDVLFNNTSQVVNIEKLKQFQSELPEDLSDIEKIAEYERFFDENSNRQDNASDNLLAEKFKENDNIVLPFTNSIDSNGNDIPIVPISKFRNYVILGHIQTPPDSDGIYRRTPTTYIEPNSGSLFDNFGTATVKAYLDMLQSETLKIPTDREGNMMINYFADPGGFKRISFIDVLRGNYDPETFKNKIVLVGLTSFKEVQDKVLTPRSNDIPMPGVELHANIIQTILESKFLQDQSAVSQIMTIAIIAVTLSIAFSFLGITLSTVLLIIAMITYLGFAHLMYRRGLIVNMIYPFLTIGLTYIAAWIYRYFIADKSKRQIKGAFSKYVSKELVNEISKNPDQVKLGGERRMITVFFSDIKGSTTWSEKIKIEDWVSQINEYFTAMETAIQKMGGTLDKYEGDAIMGFWNAPLAQPDHTLRAYVAALEMKKILYQKLHPKWKQEGKPLIEFRIGVNSGEAIVGNFGSINRFDYTVMGDTVNTASRLESAANKSYNTSIIVSGFDSTLPAAHKQTLLLRELDTVLLPGKQEAIKIYELICLQKDSTPEQQNTVQIYHSALAAYRARDFVTATTNLQKIAQDPPAQVLLARCQSIQQGQSIPGLNPETMVFSIANK